MNSIWRVQKRISWLSLRSWRFHQQTRTIGISVSERIEDSPLGSRASKVITIDYFDDLGGWVSPQTALERFVKNLNSNREISLVPILIELSSGGS